MQENKKAAPEFDYEISIVPLEKPAQDSIPRFFTDRVIGWCVLALGIFGITAVFLMTTETDSTLLLPAGAAVLLCLSQGARLLHIAKKKKYFMLRLTCIEIWPLNFFENLPRYIISPASNSASRGSKRVVFQTETGKKVYFVYEQSRKFIPGAKYDFYFHVPRSGETVTTDMLEQLRIDHAIVPDEISKEDIRE